MKKLLRLALILSIITVAYNSIEGVVSILFGAKGNTLTLLGFGIDSFVEVISGLGITHMVLRMRRQPSTENQHDAFERTALKITGSAFYLLTMGLVIGTLFKIINKQVPSTTFAGIIISVISILSMYLLMHYKLEVGHKLNSSAIIADAHCTKTCLYLSFILLASSSIYQLWHIPYVDAAGSLGIAWFAFKEGQEAWEKARNNTLESCC